MTVLTMAKSINEGLRRAMKEDDKVVILGEDVGRLGGVFRITDGLLDDYGAFRVIDTPLAESAIMGVAVGLAMRGYRPIVEIQFDGFLFPAFDQLVSQVAKHHARSEGNTLMPITIRIPYGGGIGAVEHHSESPESYFVHTPGLRVVSPSNPADAYAMTQQAIASNDPVIVLEPKRRYWEKGEVELESAPSDAGPLHQARIVRPGTDCTVIGYGPTVRTCLEAAAAAALEGHSLEVIDLRSIAPIDDETLLESVRRTGHAVVVHEAPVIGGVGAEISARLTEGAFYSLEAPVQRVGGWHTPYPPSRIEDDYLPDVDRILAAVDNALSA
jgi:2-oxoisovalerate dehydrogenase E1 component beta subunit